MRIFTDIWRGFQHELLMLTVKINILLNLQKGLILRELMFLLILFNYLFIPKTFAEPGTFTCNYTTYSNPKGLHKVEEDFILRFLISWTCR